MIVMILLGAQCVCVCVRAWQCLTPDCRSMSVCVRMMLNTAWDLLLSSFILVAATVRDLFPSDIRDSMSCQRHRRHKQKHTSCTSWNNLFPMATQRDESKRAQITVQVPCSWPQPGETGHQHRARKHCAPSLSTLVDFYREKETIINPMSFSPNPSPNCKHEKINWTAVILPFPINKQ